MNVISTHSVNEEHPDLQLAQRKTASSPSTRKLFVAPALNAHGGLVQATSAIVCYNSAGEYVTVETTDPNAECSDFDLDPPF